MTTLDPHPLSKLFPPISDEDFGKLAADIKLNGLHQPIMRYQGQILDGNNRYRACELVKIAPKFADFPGDDAAARNYVISANIHRRHLSPDQRRDIVAELRMVYRGEIVLTPIQMRAAIESLPYETPKLSATAIATMDGKTFAEALERAIERSKGPLLLNGKEVEELPASELKKPFVRSNYRRF